MNFKSNNKVKAVALASIIALGISHAGYARDYNQYTQTNHDQSSSFQVFISGSGSTNNEGTRREYYLYWCATDTTVTGTHGEQIHLKGGNWYIHSTREEWDSDWVYHNYEQLGSGGMSEDEIKQAIDDAIHNVEGDMTVDGSQEVTGDQTVDGEQTVNGGQIVSGGQTLI